MKRIICVLICSLFGISSVVVVATEKEYNNYENFIIEETGYGIIINGCVDNTVTKIHVPGVIYGKKVELRKSAFKECKNLESLSFGEGIEEIPSYLCENLKKLSDIKFSSTIKIIGRSAFYGCKNLKSINLENVKVVNASAFSACGHLNIVTHNRKLKEIHSESFAWTDLHEFDFTGVEYLGKRVFRGAGLESIYLPDVKDWDGVATADVNSETKEHWYVVHALYPLHTSETAMNNAVGTPFASDEILKVIRIRFPENSCDSYKSLFMNCNNIKNVIFENFPAELSKWEFYNTTQVVKQEDEKLHSIQRRDTWEWRKLVFVEPECGFTIYGRGDEVKQYAESIGVPFKELIDVNLNGERIWMDDCLPYIKNDRTMVPMRAIFEALGAEITWDDITKTASGVKDGVEVKITIGENVLYKNGEAIELDALAEITNDRTMLPVRAISEAFGCTVTWNNETKTVEITY